MAGRCGFGEHPLRLPEWLKGLSPFLVRIRADRIGVMAATTPATTPTTSSVTPEIEGPAALPSEQEDAL
jgi:hypothetical protein